MSRRAHDVDRCAESSVEELIKGVNAQLWRSNALMVANAVLVAIMVAVGASGRRYRHVAVTRFLFLGASALYLPIVSYVASSIGKEFCSTSGLDVFCHGRSYVALLLIWTVLVQIIGSSTSVIVAADDYHGGQRLGPSIELLARTGWTSYLVFYYAGRGFLTIISKDYTMDDILYYKEVSHYLIVLCLLSVAKILLKWYAFHKARRSFALGRNPYLIAGYMEKLQSDESPQGPLGYAQLIPPLIVMGEEKQEMEETPHGYSIKQRNSSLVTIDMVWRMASTGNDSLLASRPWLRDLCLSFALFKLLTRRFAKTHLAESGSAKAFKFVLDVLLNSGSSADRVFSVIADEISFVLDSYYTSMPTSNFGRLLPILNIILSMWIITWCLAGATLVANNYGPHNHPNQIFCRPNPKSCHFPPQYLNDDGVRIVFGNIFFNTVPTLSLFAVVMIAEAWEIVSYLCSSWVKITMLCSYLTHPSWQRFPHVQRLIGFLMKLKIKFRRSWNYHMGQRSLVPVHGQQPGMRYGLSRLIFFLSNTKMQHVKVPLEVKAAIVAALRSTNGTLSKGMAPLHKSRIGGRLLWACQGRGTSDVILAWHIATGILDLEARNGGASSTSSRPADKRTVATHLSRYCAYLVAAQPELLPDDRAWSKKLYKAMRRDMNRALAAGEAAAERDNGMATVLEERSEHEVVKRGVRLGKQLMQLVPDEEARWDLLASFWCEILLYAAPSDNLKAHKKAIAHGTELLTLIWALLTHAGIVSRPSSRNNAV